ncbi:hypothetical protein AURDEDRAFT_127548 [Auricularia subglabra TFB-10046 SS5]|nr:hypothetical protein AURDEDRAFT_127548 [Auricularia subglabra TFB-10046 SS5]
MDDDGEDKGDKVEYCLWCAEEVHDRAACPKISSRDLGVRRKAYFEVVDYVTGSVVADRAYRSAQGMLDRASLRTQDAQLALEATSAPVFYAESALIANALYRARPNENTDGQRIADLVQDCVTIGVSLRNSIYEQRRMLTYREKVVFVGVLDCTSFGKTAEELYTGVETKRRDLSKRLADGDYYDRVLGKVRPVYDPWDDEINYAGVLRALQRSFRYDGSMVTLRSFVNLLRGEFDRASSYN